MLLAALDFLPVATEGKVLIVAGAMGVQASAVTQFAGAAISTVVVTSTLARTADAASMRCCRNRQDAAGEDDAALLALTWIGYLVGAVVGALLLRSMPYPLLVPAQRCWWGDLPPRDHIGGMSPSCRR